VSSWQSSTSSTTWEFAAPFSMPPTNWLSAGAGLVHPPLDDAALQRQAPEARAYGIDSTQTGNSSLQVFLSPPADLQASIAPAHAIQVEQAQDMAVKLARLSEYFLEDYGRSLQPESVTDFLRFSRRYPALPPPQLSAESTGTLISVWKSADKTISLKFIGNCKFHYALAFKKAGRTLRPWGTFSLQAFFATYPSESAIALYAFASEDARLLAES